ncbi:MAG TPA: alpha/beta fold hydrolase [Rectinemataceae bacterium]|nr:alpha/beta fold hydrolase [Rectinemataceae bacterium]
MNHLSSYFPDPKGTRLHYQYWENMSKGYDKVALVLHGLGYHSGAYPSLVPKLLAENFKVYALDFAGFGHSPGERGSGGVLAMADAIESICRRIESVEGAREIDIIAHSIGAVAALLFLKRYPARKARLAAVAPLLFGVPVDTAPETHFEDEAARKRLEADVLVAYSVPNAFASDLDATAKSLLHDTSFLEGRKAAFFVGESDSLVPFEKLRETVETLPLKDRRFVSFPRERHDPLGGKRGLDAIAAIVAWFDETRFEHRTL